MSDFTVNPSALTDGAGKIDAAAESARAAASSLTAPPAMMLGMFASPYVATLGAAFHTHVQSLINGVGHMDDQIAENLRNTAQSYTECEDQAAELASKVGKESA